MTAFSEFKVSKSLLRAIDDLGFEKATPIQKESYSVILSGRNLVGIAQTGTGKTLAYALPLLQNHRYTTQLAPSILVIVPTRELVVQVVEQFESYSKYITLRVLGVFGGVNINTQKLAVMEGMDVLVATPGRLYDLTLSGALKLKMVKKLVIDEVDVMLDLGFRYQLTNILDLLPEKRQNIMFSATMTEEVDQIIENHFLAPVKISIAISGTPLENIKQRAIPVFNFNTKLNLLGHLLENKEEFSKILLFGPGKKLSDRIYEFLEELFGEEVGIVHSNKSQNYRLRSIEAFSGGEIRIMVTTDVMARGLDIEEVSHVINFDCPAFPENYIHRIGRTGRAEQSGESLLLFTEKERKYKEAIESLMKMEIDELAFPEEVEVNYEMIREEKSEHAIRKSARRNERKRVSGGAYHEKKAKNRKKNLGGSYRRKLAAKYKKPKTKGAKKKR